MNLYCLRKRIQYKYNTNGKTKNYMVRQKIIKNDCHLQKQNSIKTRGIQ